MNGEKIVQKYTCIGQANVLILPNLRVGQASVLTLQYILQRRLYEFEKLRDALDEKNRRRGRMCRTHILGATEHDVNWHRPPKECFLNR